MIVLQKRFDEKIKEVLCLEKALALKYGSGKYMFWIWVSDCMMVAPASNPAEVEQVDYISQDFESAEQSISEAIGDSAGLGLISKYAFVRDYWRSKW
jgi:hypothetical protein